MKSIFILIFSMLGSFVFCQESITVTHNSAKILFVIDVIKLSQTGELEICKLAEEKDCKIAEINLGQNLDYASFKSAIIYVLTNSWQELATLDVKNIPDDRIESMYDIYIQNNIQAILQNLSENRPAGVLSLKNDIVSLSEEKKCQNNITSNQVTLDFQPLNAVNMNTNASITYSLKIQNISFTISDNYISNITISGSIFSSDSKLNSEITFTNLNHSISLKAISDEAIQIKINEQKYYLCFSDMINYTPDTKSGAYSTIVKDAEFSLGKGESKTLYKRTIDDYVGISIGSDFLGFNSISANSLLVSRFDVLMPLQNKNFKRIRFFEFLNASLTFSVLNGQNGNNESLIATPFIHENVNSVEDTLFVVNYFDLLRYQNTKIDLHFSFFAYEFKSLNLIAHFTPGIEIYRSKTSTSITRNGVDFNNTYNHFSGAVPKLGLLVKYRPDLWLGADFKFDFHKSFQSFNLNNTSSNLFIDDDPLDRKGEIEFSLEEEMKEQGKGYRYYSGEINLYAQTGKKAGVFARFQLDFENFKRNAKIFPQLQIGYSTNIANYVNSTRKN